MKNKFSIIGALNYPFNFLKIRNPELNNLDYALDFVFSDKGRFIKPMQVKEEIEALLKLVQKKKPRYILEIGTARGATLFLLSRIADQNALIISLDLPKGDFGGGYSAFRIPLYKSFALKNQKIFLLRENSHNLKAFENVRRILGKNQLDFLLIDGDHTYEGVKKDFEMYSKLVKKDGIIALHDVAKHPEETGCTIDRFWKELKEKCSCKEIIKDKNRGWAGIGVLKK
jgi:predicted O-methyltransferase YrrM